LCETTNVVIYCVMPSVAISQVREYIYIMQYLLKVDVLLK